MKEDFEFFTATGITRGNECVIFTMEKQKIKCYLCNFHYNFNILLSREALKQLKSSWIIDKDLIKMGDNVFKLQCLERSNIETSGKENHSMEVKRIEICSNHLNSQERNELEKL